MKWIYDIKNAIFFIEDNLLENISAEDVSNHIHCIDRLLPKNIQYCKVSSENLRCFLPLSLERSMTMKTVSMVCLAQNGENGTQTVG